MKGRQVRGSTAGQRGAVDLQDSEASPEQRVVGGTAHSLKQPLIPRWFKALLGVAFPFGVAYQLAGIAWATAVAVALSLLFAVITMALDAFRERL